MFLGLRNISGVGFNLSNSIDTFTGLLAFLLVSEDCNNMVLDTSLFGNVSILDTNRPQTEVRLRTIG